MHAGTGIVGAPLFGYLQDFPSESLLVGTVKSVKSCHGLLDAKVISGKYIFPAQSKHKQHLCSPPAHALDPGEMMYYLLIIHLADNPVIQSLLQGESGYIKDIACLCPG